MKKRAIIENGLFITYAVYSTKQAYIYRMLKAERGKPNAAQTRANIAVDVIARYCKEQRIMWEKFRIISVYSSKIIEEPVYIIEAFLQPDNQ